MPSRKARKRYRRLAGPGRDPIKTGPGATAADTAATAARDERTRHGGSDRTSGLRTHAKPLGGWGRGAPIRRGDWLLVRQPIREGWDVPDAVREQVPALACRVARDPEAKPQDLLAAVRALLAMDGDNLRPR